MRMNLSVELRFGVSGSIEDRFFSFRFMLLRIETRDLVVGKKISLTE